MREKKLEKYYFNGWLNGWKCNTFFCSVCIVIRTVKHLKTIERENRGWINVGEPDGGDGGNKREILLLASNGICQVSRLRIQIETE